MNVKIIQLIVSMLTTIVVGKMLNATAMEAAIFAMLTLILLRVDYNEQT